MSRRIHARGSLAVMLALAGLAVAGCTQTSDASDVLPLEDTRAYSGAPPVTPHPVASLGRQDCLGCHLLGDAVSDHGARAKPTPHPELVACTQCHVERVATGQFRRSRFKGKSYRIGLRSQPAGPWLIPHPLTLREACLGCHGEGAHPRLATTHPEREHCMQCHVPAYAGFPGPRAWN